MKLSSEQAKKLIAKIQDAELPEFFSAIKAIGINDPRLKELEKEFIFGRFPYDFYDRLQVFVNSLAQTDYEVKQPKYDIFVSYSSKNREKASRVVQTLRKSGLVVFFSDDDLKNHAGTSFIGKINTALTESKHFLLYCTPESVASPFVQHECETFLRQHIESQKKRKIFILQGDGFSMDLLNPLHFQNIQTSDLEGLITILGKKMPKNNLEDRKADYKDLFEVFFEDGNISTKERKQLEKEQKNLGLIAEDIAEVEAEVKKNYQVKKTTKTPETTASKPQAISQSAVNTNTTTKPENSLSPEMLKYIGIGVGVVFILLIVIFWFPKGEDEASDTDHSESEMSSNDTETYEEEEGDDEIPEEEDFREAIEVNGVTFYMVKLPKVNFKIAEVEVTQDFWKAIMGYNPSIHQGCPACPVENISYLEAQTFLLELNGLTGRSFRLPSNEEWVYAAQGGNELTYAGSNNLDEVAWYQANSEKLAHPVASKMPNTYGLFDMSGNVWEMVSNDSAENITIRGGSWTNEAISCEIATNFTFPKDSKAQDVGFRLLLDK